MKKRIIQAVIFLMGVFLFTVVLTPRYLGDKSDSKAVDSPSVIRDSEAEDYRMYYTGYLLGGPGSLHVATSRDGLKWKKYQGNPLIERSWVGSADAASIGKSVVLKIRDTYKCFYFGKSMSENNSICLAESEDGLTWRKHKNNPVLSKERPLPKSEDVENWPEEKLSVYLRGLNFPEGPVEISKTVWLEQFLRILQDTPGMEFNKFERQSAMALVAWTMPDVINNDFRLSDFPKLQDKVRKMAQGADDMPEWPKVRQMTEEEVTSTLERLGIRPEAFTVDKRDLLLHMLKTLEGKMSKTEILRYFKAVDAAAFQMSRKNLPDLRDSLTKRLTNGGFEGDEFIDFSLIYDSEADLYRMWYIGKKQYPLEPPMQLVGYAESKDGIKWKRKLGPLAKGAILESKHAAKVSAIRCEDGMFRMVLTEAVEEDEPVFEVSAFESSDGIENWEFLGKVDVRDLDGGNGIKFDDGGIQSLFLTQLDGEYYLYYGGNLNKWDKPFPTIEELRNLSVRNLYKCAEMVGFRMSRWNREYNYENLSIAKVALEKPEELNSLDDQKIRDLALYFWLEIDLNGDDLSKIDPERLIFFIRKSLLKRTFIEFGKAIYYPSLEEIEKMTRSELLENCSKYAIAGISDLGAADDDEMRQGLRTFSQLCAGRKDYVETLSQDQLIKIMNDYNISVRIDPHRDLRDEVDNIPRETIQKTLLSTLGYRRANFIEQQKEMDNKSEPTRIGFITSTDLKNWKRFKGDKHAGSVLETNPHGVKNPLLKAEGEVSRAIIILGWFAVGLGLINLTRHHGKNILKKGKNYMMSAAFFASLIAAFVIMCLFYPYYARFIQVPNPYKFMQNFIAEPIIACILGLLGYYITSAAYRAFRVQNVEAAMMMLIAVLCMLGNISIFEQYSRSWFLHTAFDQFHFPYIRNWLMNNANAAVFRGLNFGISIGVIAMSIRIILGLEKGAFFEKL